MPDTDQDAANVAAVLRLIRWAEHYPAESDDVYDVLYGGARFSGYATPIGR